MNVCLCVCVCVCMCMCVCVCVCVCLHIVFPGSSAGKESACNTGDPGLIPESGQSPGGGHGNPLQYSCLENPKTEKPGRPQSTGHNESP